MESKGRLLPVGAWRHIQNFTLSPSTGMYRATDHPFKMSIIQNTAITRSPLINEDMFLSLVDFQTVLGGSLKTCFLIGNYLRILLICFTLVASVYLLMFFFFQMWLVKLWTWEILKLFKSQANQGWKWSLPFATWSLYSWTSYFF